MKVIMTSAAPAAAAKSGESNILGILLVTAILGGLAYLGYQYFANPDKEPEKEAA